MEARTDERIQGRKEGRQGGREGGRQIKAEVPTSFSCTLSPAVSTLWPSSPTSLSKSARTSLNPELTGPMSSSRMDARNGCTLSPQLLSAGWATMAEEGKSPKHM
jgi:hypothetical protein